MIYIDFQFIIQKQCHTHFSHPRGYHKFWGVLVPTFRGGNFGVLCWGFMQITERLGALDAGDRCLSWIVFFDCLRGEVWWDVSLPKARLRNEVIVFFLMLQVFFVWIFLGVDHSSPSWSEVLTIFWSLYSRIATWNSRSPQNRDDSLETLIPCWKCSVFFWRIGHVSPYQEASS